MRSWEDLRAKLGLDDNKKFYWRQIIHAIPRAWKEMFFECGNNINDLIIKEHHLIQKHQIYCLEKLNSRELYNMQLILKVEKPTAQIYFEKIFQNPKLEWKDMYTLPRRATINTNLRIFQYKLLHNILYLNVMLYKFGKKVFPLCSFCMKEPESPIHFFHSCTKTTFLWTQLQYSFQNVLIIPSITLQNAIFGFTDHKENYHLINHILLTFKYYVSKSRENGPLDLKVLKKKHS